MMRSICYPLFSLVLVFGTSCSSDDGEVRSCVEGMLPIWAYTSPEGLQVEVYENGEAYIVTDGVCEFGAQFFTPGFFEGAYTRSGSDVFLNLDGDLLATYQEFEENFEDQTEELEFIRLAADQEDRLFTGFTLQSPSAKTVSEYVALQRCILDGTCDFIDNRIDHVPDPTNAENNVLKFFSVAPTADMVTAKSSIVSTLIFFEKGDDFWFEAKFFLEGDHPETIADFESSFFEGSVGTRIFFDDDKLFLENKFGSKIKYEQTGAGLSFPQNQWVTVKLHLNYDEVDGVIQMWQDDQLIIDARGPNMPVYFWIQDRLEVGISATDVETTLFVDDIRISDQEL